MRNVIFNKNSDICDSYLQKTVPVCFEYQDAIELGNETNIVTNENETVNASQNPNDEEESCYNFRPRQNLRIHKNAMMLILQKFPEHMKRQLTQLNQRIGRMQ